MRAVPMSTLLFSRTAAQIDVSSRNEGNEKCATCVPIPRYVANVVPMYVANVVPLLQM
jgi:hypothetical protein